MAKNKNVNIKIAADVEDAKKGIDKVTQQLNKFAKDSKSKLNTLSKLGGAINAVTGTFSIATGVFNKAKSAIDDVTQAYNKQATAEKQLEAAAKNNPYLSDYSVDQLKKYASELQSISTVGDEELLPMMAQLAAAGRTQAEIQDIMAASLDISASGAMSLETAVKQLNATYSGTAGRLGQMNGAVKGLTTEQLKNGEAVRIMKEQYSGIAKSVADTTGGWQQFKNTLGDIKESLGSTFANLQNSAGKVLNNFFGTIVEKLQAAGKEADEFKKKLNIIATIDDDKASVADLEGVITQLTDDLGKMQSVQKIINQTQSEYSKEQKANYKVVEENYKKNLKILEETEKQADVNLKLLESQRQAELLNSTSIEETEKIYKKYADSIADATSAYKEAKYNSDNFASSEKKNVDELKAKYKNANAEFLSLNNLFQSSWSGSEKKLEEEIKKVEGQLVLAQEKLAEAQAKAKKEADAADGTAKVKNSREEIEKNTRALKANEQAILDKYELMDKTGEKYEELDKLKELQAARESSYLSLIKVVAEEEQKRIEGKESKALDEKTIDDAAIARLSEIEDGYKKIAAAMKAKAKAEGDRKALEEMTKETEKLSEEARKFVSEFDETKLSARIGSTILRLIEQRDAITDNTKAQEAYNQKIRELEGLLEQVQAKESEGAAKESEGAASGIGSDLQSWAQAHEQKLQIAADFAGKYAEIMQGISDLACETAENEATVKQAELEKQLEDGLITEDEYAEKKEQIEKESAEKQYRMQMWAWAANLVNIQAQTALAIASTLAQEQGPAALKIAMSAMIGAMGAVQLATAIANKPVPPSFATGGVVGGFQGASMGGDNTYAHVRSGEMILNAKQQRAMFDTLNGGGNGGGGTQMNVTIKNTAANVVSATPRMTSQGMEVLIRQTVRKQMENGDYDSSLRTASLNENGIRYSS